MYNVNNIYVILIYKYYYNLFQLYNNVIPIIYSSSKVIDGGPPHFLLEFLLEFLLDFLPPFGLRVRRPPFLC